MGYKRHGTTVNAQKRIYLHCFYTGFTGGLMDLTSKKDIEEFTGCKTAKAQILVLKARKIKHVVNIRDEPVAAKVVLARAGAPAKPITVVPSSEHISGLQSMPRNGVGIYFLLQCEEVVYIGKTTNFFGRMAAHDGGEYTFDSVRFLPAPEKNLDILEREYIARFKPKYNKMHNN